VELASLASYATLFGAAFLAATIIPAQSELVLAAMMMSGRFDTAALLLIATSGNTLGAVLNWVLGRFVETFRDRRWFPISANALRRGQTLYGKRVLRAALFVT